MWGNDREFYQAGSHGRMGPHRENGQSREGFLVPWPGDLHSPFLPTRPPARIPQLGRGEEKKIVCI